MLLFSVYNIECGVAIYLSTKRRGCVHPLRPPSSNHCAEVLSFLDKAANLRLFLLWQGAGNIPVHDRQMLYSFWLRFHSTLRDSAGPSSTIFFCFTLFAGHILLSIYTTKFYHFVNKSFNALELKIFIHITFFYNNLCGIKK